MAKVIWRATVDGVANGLDMTYGLNNKYLYGIGQSRYK